MMKRAFAEISGHHVEQQRLKRKDEGYTIYASDGLERDEANVERNGCVALLNGDSETHTKVDSMGKNAEASAIGSFSSQKEFSSSDAVLNQEGDTLSDSSRSCPERSIYFSATRPTNKDFQRSNSSQSDQARLSQVDQTFTSSDSSSEDTHATAVNNHLLIDILPVENNNELKERFIHDDFENNNDLKSTNLVGAVEKSYTPVDVASGYHDNKEMILETNFSSNSFTELEMQNNINGEIASQSYLTKGPSFETEQDMVDRTSIDLSCSIEDVWQHKIHNVPLLTECGSVEKSFRKKTQATISERMNCTMQEENPSEHSFSSAISIEINQKFLCTNFKGELNLPPSPITGVINCFVSKPNGDTEHFDSLKEEDTAFSFQTPNRSFSKEKPKNEIGYEMQAALDSEVVSFRSILEDNPLLEEKNKVVQEIGFIPLERSLTYDTRKKLIVLDLNGLLCDIVNDYYSSYVAIKKVGGKPFFKRPFCDEFLKFCFDNFHIGIWSSRRKYNVDIALDYLMGEFKHKLLFCWDQSKCTYTGERTIENRHKPLVLKELKKLWNKEESDLPWQNGDFSPSNTLLLDDSPYKALRNPPHTAIFPYPYQYTDERDNSLGRGGDIRVYLEQLLSSDDVQHFVEQHPFGQPAITTSHQHWPFYCQIIQRNSTQLS